MNHFKVTPYYENQLLFNVDFPQSSKMQSWDKQPGPIVIEKFSPCVTPPPKKLAHSQVSFCQ